MENIKIFIATPCYGGLVYSSYTESLLYTCMLLSSKNIQLEVNLLIIKLLQEPEICYVPYL